MSKERMKSILITILLSVGLAVVLFLMIIKPVIILPVATLWVLLWLTSERFPRSEKIKVKYFDNGIEELHKFKVGDWIDLRCSQSVILKQGEYRLLKLGVGMVLPEGYEAHIVSRSSTPDRFGIICANSMGIIDNSYSGDGDEWMFPALAIRNTVIEKGDRIAQFRIMKNQPAIDFETVESLGEVSRGGIGSTGRR